MTTPTTTRTFAAVAAVLFSLSLAACGGGDSKAKDDAASFDDAQAAALKFSRCMRENGVDMPDPQTSSAGTQGGSKNEFEIDATDPNFKRAQEACSKYLKGGIGVTPTKSGLEKPGNDPEAEAALLKVTRCMREQGIDVPDPQNGAVSFPEDFDPNDPAYKAAQDKCKWGELSPPGS